MLQPVACIAGSGRALPRRGVFSWGGRRFPKNRRPHAAQRSLLRRVFSADGKLLFINEYGPGGIPLEDSPCWVQALNRSRRLRVRIRLQVHTVVRAARQIEFPCRRQQATCERQTRFSRCRLLPYSARARAGVRFLPWTTTFPASEE